MLLNASQPLPAAPAERSTLIEPRIDLRRAATRLMGEKIVARASFLAPCDRALIEAVFRDHVPIATLARATDSSPNRIARRIRTLLRRLTSARIVWVISHRDDWPVERRRIADAHYLQGATQRAAARSLGVSIHRVRTQLAALRALEEVSDIRSALAPMRPERNP